MAKKKKFRGESSDPEASIARTFYSFSFARDHYN
jgi:hypothetical protein